MLHSVSLSFTLNGPWCIWAFAPHIDAGEKCEAFKGEDETGHWCRSGQNTYIFTTERTFDQII